MNKRACFYAYASFDFHFYNLLTIVEAELHVDSACNIMSCEHFRCDEMMFKFKFVQVLDVVHSSL